MWKALFAFLGVAAGGAILWFVVHLIQQGPVQKAKAEQAQDTTRVTAAQGELNTGAAKAAATTEIHLQPIYQREKETVHAIEIAPGSDTPIHPRSAGAFYGGLCAQPWRAADPVCRADDPGGPVAAPGVPAPAPAP